MTEKIKKWYRQGLWTCSMVYQAAQKGVLTQQEADGILKEESHV